MLEKKEKEQQLETFKNQLKELKEKVKKGDTSAVRQSLGGGADFLSSSSSSSGGASSTDAAGGGAPSVPPKYRQPPKTSDPVNPDKRTRTLEGPQKGTGLDHSHPLTHPLNTSSQHTSSQYTLSTHILSTHPLTHILAHPRALS